MIRITIIVIILAFLVALIALGSMRLVLPACDVRPPELVFFAGACPEPIPGVDDELAAAIAHRHYLLTRIADSQRRLSQVECSNASYSRAQVPAVIDREAWEEEDISLLEGCWELDSNFQIEDTSTGEVRTVSDWTMCFNGSGTGSETLSMGSNTVCASDRVSAAFDTSGNLVIRDNENVPCSGNWIDYIYEGIMTCALADDGTAACETWQPETGARSPVTFRR